MDNTNKENFQVVKSLVKAIHILDCFTSDKPELSLAEIANMMQMPKSTALNLLRTMEQEGLITRAYPSMNYRLGYKIMNLNYRMQMAMPIIRLSTSYLENLQLRTGKTVYLSTHMDGQVFYLDAVYSSRSSVPYSSNGKYLNMHCTGCGKAMLAYLSKEEIDAIIERHGLPKFTETTITSKEALYKELAQIRKQGYSIDDGEETSGLRCIAVPILNEDNYPTAALSISGSVYLMTDPQLMEYLDPLLTASQALSHNANEFPAGQIRLMQKATK